MTQSGTMPKLSREVVRTIIGAVYEKIHKEYRCEDSGVYDAKSIDHILSTKRLEGCQDWGTLVVYLMGQRGVICRYVQCVELNWLEKSGRTFDSDGWHGHVFLEVVIDGEPVSFCSTSGQIVEQDQRCGFEILDGHYIVLFKGDGPDNVRTGNGVYPLIKHLYCQWKEGKDAQQVDAPEPTP